MKNNAKSLPGDLQRFQKDLSTKPFVFEHGVSVFDTVNIIAGLLVNSLSLQGRINSNHTPYQTGIH